MTILVTGGAGYIGSHTCVALLDAGYDITVLDNFSNSSPESLHRVKEITGKNFTVHEVDLLDAHAVDNVFAEEKIDAVVHFAALKAVGESVEKPLAYYHNNITGTIHLLQVMEKHGVTKFVFSSSATVYSGGGDPPFTETSPLGATNPYGQTKVMLEQILVDYCAAHPSWSAALLRYFNPIGAHESGRIGEHPNGIPNNLLPYITQVAVGKRELLTVNGTDYPTPDGTCVRDYIHVVDLAVGHVKALEYIENRSGAEAFNLGSGQGRSVLEVIHAFEEASGLEIPRRVGPRRPGDAPFSFADPSRANAVLGWRAEKSLVEMCRDSWRWQQQNPEGFGE